MVEIAYLADHVDAIPTLAEWFKAQWAEYYAQRTLADIEQDFSEELNRDYIPIRLVAFVDGELAGTIVLRELAIQNLPEYSPGLGGLYVDRLFRRKGLATELIKAGTALAEALGYQVIYTATNNARGILERLGWERIRTVFLPGEEVGLFRWQKGM